MATKTKSEVGTPLVTTYKGVSVVDALKSVGVDSSFDNRAELAVKAGIVKDEDDYKGTAKQNLALLKDLKTPAETPKPTPVKTPAPVKTPTTPKKTTPKTTKTPAVVKTPTITTPTIGEPIEAQTADDTEDTYSDYVYYVPCPAPPPPFIPFNEQPPTFSSDLKKVNKYSYFFGLDKLLIKNATANQNCCFISQELSLGEITQDGYIQLEAEFSNENNSAIEFYIVDGSKEVPILPVGQSFVLNEKIFFGLNTRFAVNDSKGYEIKRNGIIVDITLDKAIQSTDALYTVTYTTVTSFNYKPINNSVKIKTVLRIYDKNANSPDITKMKIRKFGGGTLWKQDISIL